MSGRLVEAGGLRGGGALGMLEFLVCKQTTLGLLGTRRSLGELRIECKQAKQEAQLRAVPRHTVPLAR